MAQRLAGESNNTKFDTQRPEKEVTTTTIDDKTYLDTNSTNYWQELALGNINGSQASLIAGENPDVEPGAEETIWSQGGRLIPLTADTELYFSSTDAADDQVWTAIGLNNALEVVVGIATLNGQNQVQISEDMFRITRILNISSTSSAGNIYLAESDTLTGGVPDTASKIQMKSRIGFNGESAAFWTVRAGKTGYVNSMEGTVGKSKNVTIYINAIIPGIAEFKLFPFKIFQSAFKFFNPLGFEVEAGQTIEITATTDDPASPITVKLNIVEVDV